MDVDEVLRQPYRKKKARERRGRKTTKPNEGTAAAEDEKTNERETYGLDELERRAGISQRTRGPNLYEDETGAHVNKKKRGRERK